MVSYVHDLGLGGRKGLWLGNRGGGEGERGTEGCLA
jgi:hypothetical protein